MTTNGHVARARAAGLAANRTLVRNAVAMMLRAPNAPVYIVYDRIERRLRTTDARPSHGVWRQVGPVDLTNVTVMQLAREIEFLATECRAAA